MGWLKGSIDQYAEAKLGLMPLMFNVKRQQRTVDEFKGTTEEFKKELECLRQLRMLLVEKETENTMLHYQLENGEIGRVLKEW